VLGEDRDGHKDSGDPGDTSQAYKEIPQRGGELEKVHMNSSCLFKGSNLVGIRRKSYTGPCGG